MKVKALINYYDKELKRNIKAGTTYEVESEKRLKELLGENDKKIICCEVITEAEKDNKEAENNKKPEKNKKNAKRK